MRELLLLIVMLLCPAPASAERADTRRHDSSAAVDLAVLQQMHEQRIPGIAVPIVRDGKLIKAKGYGLANVELGVPVSNRTVFEAGSITKQFVAAAVIELVEEGKLGLDDSIVKYFPEARPALRPVTIPGPKCPQWVGS